MHGIIKKIMEKGFGFLSVEGRDKDLFFHANEVVGGKNAFGTLREGDNVKFRDIVRDTKGDSAVGVELE